MNVAVWVANLRANNVRPYTVGGDISPVVGAATCRLILRLSTGAKMNVPVWVAELRANNVRPYTIERVISPTVGAATCRLILKDKHRCENECTRRGR